MPSVTPHSPASTASRLRAWLLGFAPAPVTLSARERLRSCVGALVGIACVGLTMRMLPGIPEAMPLLVAPMGASAVLLFAVPASPLAQPWSLLGGNLVAATVGVACARWIADPVGAAALAIALAIGAMLALRCVHPPSGAVALTAVVGGPAVHALGFGFVLEPIALQSAALLVAALIYHALTGHRYPHRAAAPREAQQRPAGGFSREDLEAVLKRRTEWLDVSTDDLDALLRETELHAYARTFGALSCADIAAHPEARLNADTRVAAALAMLDRLGASALPVVDATQRLLGIVTRDALAPLASAASAASAHPAVIDAKRDPAIASLVIADVPTILSTEPITDLVPRFAEAGEPVIVVVDAAARPVGLVTQADLIAGLYRRTQVLKAA
ncbi:HPP family protein [Burkholderia sp. Ac-20379]|uniref:HPP family protein n=1 Tax=Burkholderia sp. Ac-20379 TaxID=2703900 RepID=UPI00198134D7|nr:HPP family protein [Burkholderia sp. Ac-20379]MBN3723450.1 HPP family protein [Burkholderia sp. Ac-20379]